MTCFNVQVFWLNVKDITNEMRYLEVTRHTTIMEVKLMLAEKQGASASE